MTPDPPCTCKVTGPAPGQTRFNPTCPYHGKGGSMVATVPVKRPRET